jgi:hypothetical protein
MCHEGADSRVAVLADVVIEATVRVEPQAGQ